MSDCTVSSIIPEIREETVPASPDVQNGDENVVISSIQNIRLDQLKVDDEANSSVYTSEEEGGSRNASDENDRSKSPEPEFIAPDDELRDKIVKQVEFYFSDANILKDAFLLKHVRRNKQGYVSIKLITSFKKMKSLTKDYRVVAYSLRLSDKLDVNEEGRKVRRKDPLPEYDETIPSRSIVVVNLPMENPTIENVAEVFSKCGEVSLIRILRPGKTIPQDVKKHANKHPEIGTTTCAVIEFEKHEHAKLAVERLNNTDDWRKGMRVVLLSAQKKKDRKDQNGQGNDTGKEDDEEDSKKLKRDVNRRKKNRIDELAKNNDSSCYSSGSEVESSGRGRQSHQTSLSPNHLDVNKLSPGNSPRSSPRSSPMTSPRMQRSKFQHGKSPLADNSPNLSPRHSPRSSPETSRKQYTDYSSGGEGSPSSPWIRRRMLKAAQEKSPLASNESNGPKRMHDMEGVVRQPKGPDGTIGFHLGRGKPRSSTFS
ncbi:LARP6 [Mytilus edulis]|uniref:LARP6 n=1 Tax=Mytilus edulis TaxID=6550 RepID=A0A8S3T5H7_MYTED|nr:LARP6 [Mytilus edulis]